MVSEQPASAMADLSSPLPSIDSELYKLTTSDYGVHTLVSQVLTGMNYHVWRWTVLTALEARNKCGFVDGSFPPPSSSAPHYSDWRCTISMIITWLMNCVSKEILPSLSHPVSARDLWLELEERYYIVNATRLFDLKRLMSSLTQDTLSITDYYTKLKSLWDEYSHLQPLPDCTCGGLSHLQSTLDQNLVMHFLMGLADTFSHVRSQILLMEPFPKITKAYHLLLQEEQCQQSVHAALLNKPELAAFSSHRPSPSVPFSKTHPSKRNKPICHYCRKPGHIVDKCFKLHGFPSDSSCKAWSTPSSPLPSINSVAPASISLDQSFQSLHLFDQQRSHLLNFLAGVRTGRYARGGVNCVLDTRTPNSSLYTTCVINMQRKS